MSRSCSRDQGRSRHGDGDIRSDGGTFRPDWFTLINRAAVPDRIEKIRTEGADREARGAQRVRRYRPAGISGILGR